MQDIHIIGTGAMACLWASYLSTHCNLHFIQRRAPRSTFKFDVLPHGQTVSGNSLTADTLTTPIQHLIVATKAFDAKAALDDIQQYLSAEAQILLLQNGMGSQQAISETYPQYAVYACSSTEGAYKSNHNTLVHAGSGTNSIGPMTNPASFARLQKWLPENRFTWHQDIEPVLWKKLIINSVINPLTVIYQCKNGELLKQTSIQNHMHKICTELDLLLKTLPFETPPAYSLAKEICQLTANNFSSMYQDWQHNRPTEINFITGFIVQSCQKKSISCPHNKKLLEKIQQLSLGA
jgi:2-dehydropantoate 2-reductase